RRSSTGSSRSTGIGRARSSPGSTARSSCSVRATPGRPRRSSLTGSRGRRSGRSSAAPTPRSALRSWRQACRLARGTRSPRPSARDCARWRRWAWPRPRPRRASPPSRRGWSRTRAYAADGESRRRYPKCPVAEGTVGTFAEAHGATGRADAARPALGRCLTSPDADMKLGRAWLLLARARAAARDRVGALDAYARAAKEGRGPEWGKPETLAYARLLAEDKRASEARGILSEFLRRADGADAADAAYALGETYQGEGDFPAAVECFMTAAYVAPESAPGR